jgi:hypothetical protein
LLDSVLVGLAGKAKLTQRGEAYYRKEAQGLVKIPKAMLKNGGE